MSVITRAEREHLERVMGHKFAGYWADEGHFKFSMGFGDVNAGKPDFAYKILALDKFRPDGWLSKIQQLRPLVGLLPDGTKKPTVCWSFVKTGQCGHNGTSMVRGGKWHPCEKERVYLKAKVCK